MTMEPKQSVGSEIKIRVAEEADAEALLAIYAPYIRETAITFEYEVPSVEEFRERIREILKKYPYLAAERDGEILGYAYAHAFHERAAFAWAAEASIYIRKDMRKSGLGRRLYEALENILREQGVINLNASISSAAVDDEYLTGNSRSFHKHMGYRLVGEFHQCGYKFGRWYNTTWMEKDLGEHKTEMEPIKSFDEIREKIREKYGIS